jgi:hypothetical protein
MSEETNEPPSEPRVVYIDLPSDTQQELPPGIAEQFPELLHPRPRVPLLQLWSYWVVANSAGIACYLLVVVNLINAFVPKAPRGGFPHPFWVLAHLCAAAVLCWSIAWLQGLVLRGAGFPARFWSLFNLLISFGAFAGVSISVGAFFRLLEPVLQIPQLGWNGVMFIYLLAFGLVLGFCQANWLRQQPRETLIWSLASGVGFALGGLAVGWLRAAVTRQQVEDTLAHFSLAVTVLFLAYAAITGLALGRLRLPHELDWEQKVRRVLREQLPTAAIRGSAEKQP